MVSEIPESAETPARVCVLILIMLEYGLGALVQQMALKMIQES